MSSNQARDTSYSQQTQPYSTQPQQPHPSYHTFPPPYSYQDISNIHQQPPPPYEGTQ